MTIRKSRRVQFDRYGPADVLHVVDRPRPTAGEGQPGGCLLTGQVVSGVEVT